MSSCFESFGYDGVYTCFFTFGGKLGACHYMGHNDYMLKQEFSPGLWISGRGEDDFHTLFYYHIDKDVYFGIHQRNVYSERFVCRRFAFLYVFA